MTETTGARDETWARRLLGPEKPRTPESVAFDPNNVTVQPFQVVDFERQASFFMTGGLVAVHSEGRDRDAIWNALDSRVVSTIATDHAPHTQEVKEMPFDEAPPGMLGLETALALAVTELVPAGIDLARIVALLSWQPARIAGLAVPGDGGASAECAPDVKLMLDFLSTASPQRGIVR